MKKNHLSVTVAVLALFLCRFAGAATGWSTQDYDLYSGDFNGDGKDDILYVAKDPENASGIALSDATGGPNTPGQSWPSNYLGIPWYSNIYRVIVTDFNGDGRADILLQRSTAGNSYLLLANAQGKITGISQTISNTAVGLTWSADQHRIIAGDFNHDGKADLFFQAAQPSGLNAVVLADSNGQFTASSPAQSWNDGYLGFHWAGSEAMVYAGDFNGDGRTDLLIQARPKFVMISFDVDIPVPTYPPNMNGFVPAQATGALFTATGMQAWSRNAFGVDWSPLATNLVVGGFNRSACTTCSDLIIQAKGTGRTSYLVTGNTSGAIFSTGVALASNVNWSADAFHIVAAGFTGSTSNTGVYLQSVNGSGTNYFADNIVGSTVSVTAHDSSVPTGVVPATAVGKTSGSFAVSPMGAATFSVKITAPVGVSGVEPGISIAYESGVANGQLGVGWDLTGLSQIERCKKTLVEDGSVDSVALTSADLFCLDGNKLRLTGGTYGADGSTYQSETETFSRTTAYGSAGNGPAYFKVETKGGLIYEYGNTTDSRILSLNPAATTTARVWALNKVTDAVGNTMTVIYQNDGSPKGSYRPLEMDYTSNSAAGLAAAYKVKFVWESRPDPVSYYVAGGLVNETYRLNRVETQYNDPAAGAFRLVRRYQLSYNASGSTSHSRLASIQECDKDAKCLAPTMISWQEGQSGWSGSETVSSSDSTAAMQASVALDIDGDGRDDLVYPQGNTWWYMLASASGGFTPPVNTNIDASNGIALPIDYFSEGRLGLLISPTGYSTRQILRWNGSTLALTNTNLTLTLNGSEWIGDFDGDGHPDLLYSSMSGSTGNLYVQKNSAATSGTANFASAALFYTASNVTGFTPFGNNSAQLAARLVDFNGDGRADFIYKTTDGSCGAFCAWKTTWTALVSTGTGFVQTQTWQCTSAGVNTCALQPVVGDFNGDGKTDVVIPTGAIGSVNWQILFGSGTGLAAPVTVSVPSDFMQNKGLAIDYDGDGRDDLLYASTSGAVWNVLLWNGSNFSSPVPTNIPFGVTLNDTVRAIDLNGDGLQDLGYQNGSFRVRLRSGVFGDMVNAISDGYGNTLSINYAPLTDSTVYTKGVAPAFPEVAVQSPIYVVKSFTAADAVGGTYTVTESYQGLKTHLQGRGLEGFASRTETDGRNGIQTKYLYYQAFPFIGNINSVTVSQPNGKTIVQTTTTYSDLQTSTAAFNDRHYPFVGNRVDKKYEVSSTASVDGLAIAQTTTTTVIDSYGNPTNITSTVADQTGSGLSYVTQTTNTPVNDTANWCLGFVTQQQVTSTVPNLPAQTRTVQFVQDTTVPRACRPAQKIVEPASTAWKVTTAYQYDTFGHENWQKVTATGIADRISTTDYGTQGVFPVGVTNAAGESATKTYDYALGVPLTAKDANLINVSWQYDGFGRKTLESRFDGTSTRWWLYACSATSSFCGDSLARYEILEQQFDNTGVGVIRSQATVYDGFARPLYVESQSLSGSMSVVATKYDNLGRVQTRTQPYFAGSTAYSTVYTYDLLGRPLLEKQPTNAADATTTYPYCAVCRTTQYGYSQLTHTVTDANTHVTKSISDATGQIVQVVDPALGNTYYTYDQFGNVLTVMDPKSNTITNTYNIRGFKMSAADPDMGTWSFDYYPTGELKTQTDAKGQVATFVFDGVSRMLTRTEPEGTTTFTYGSNSSIKNVGKLQSISAPGGVSQTFTFDSTGRPQDTTTTIDGTSYVVSNSYEPATGLLSTVTYPASTTAVPGSRFKVQYEYNYGLLADVKDANSGTVYWTNLATDPAGRTITEQFGNGLNSYTTYDLANGAMQSRFTGNSNQIQNLTYQWDKVGNLTERKDATLTMTEDFAYDSLNRMWQVKLNNSVSSTISYDTNGNILSKTGVGSYDYTTQQSGCSYTGLTAQPHAVRNAGGAVYCYDANGNAIKRAGSTISWTSYNLPSLINQGANSAQFFYDANRARYKQISVTAAGGNLPAGTETTVYVGALFEKVTKPSGVIEYKHYIKAGSESVAIRTLRSNSVNDTRYLHKDHLGGIDTVTDETGSIVLKMSFDAFGLRRNPASWSGNPSPSDWSNIAAMTHRGFTGHEMLDNVGLVHMNGRVYDPTIGRFLSADPNIQAPFLSQSLNRYSYVMNNPLSYADPTGYFLGGFFHSLFRFLNAFSRFLILPTAGHFFEAVKAQPGQRQVDQFIVSHKWAYQIGEVAASIATSWGYGFGGAVWASYYTYVQTGSEWKAAKVGAIVMAANYVLKNLADGIKEGVNDWANEHGQWYLVSQGAGEPVPLEGPIGGYKIFVNGMLNDLKLAASNALQQSGESEVELFYNPTHGFIADLTESVLMKVTGSSSLGNQLAEALANTPGISEIFAHSQGSLVVSNAMGVLAQEGFHFTADFGVVYFGNAANNMVARELANKIGANFVGGFSHEFDLVGNVVGMNTLNPIKIIGSILRAPTLMMGPAWSPHSLYLYSEIK